MIITYFELKVLEFRTLILLSILSDLRLTVSGKIYDPFY